MADRVHTKLAKDERAFAGQILQAQQIPLEIALVVQINIEAAKIDILRKEVLGRRIRRVRKQHIRIESASDPNELLDKLSNAAHSEPAHHCGGDFVSNQIPEDRRMTGIGD